MEQHKNPFLEKNYGTPFDTVPFQDIRFEDYEPAMMEGMKRDDADIDKIVSNPDTPTFENTIIPKGDHTLQRATTAFFNLLSAHTNDDMDLLAQKMQPLLTEHSNKQLLNEPLWLRIKAVHDNPGRTLDAEEQTLLDELYDGFVRQGALLSTEQKKQLGELRKELGMAVLRFQQNELKDTNAFQLHITDEADLSGLPDSARDAAALAAKERGKEGWIFTLHAPSYGPFLTYADKRELRRQMYMAKNTICIGQNDQNNEEIVRRIVNLRRERAQMLGYRTYADLVLKERMAETADNVYHLLDQLVDAYMEPARKEVQEIEDGARRAEGDAFVLEPWDFSYYGHKLKMERFNIDAEMLRPYLELARVKEGVFGLATRLYGITFRENPDIPVYHPDVTAYEVLDGDGSFLAVLYTDFYPRKGKQSGAWMTSFKEQWIGPDFDESTLGETAPNKTALSDSIAQNPPILLPPTDRPTTPLPDFAQVQKIAYDERYAYFDWADVRESCVLRAPHYSIFL